jgi:hypothetical protein
MPAPEGYVDRSAAERITGYDRNTITQAAKRGDIPGAFQRLGRGPWYFTERGLRQWIGMPDKGAA